MMSDNIDFATLEQQIGGQCTVSLSANQSKSSVLVIGGNKKMVREAKADLKNDPVKLHDKPVDVKEKDLYLGMVIHLDGAKLVSRQQLKQGQKEPG